MKSKDWIIKNRYNLSCTRDITKFLGIIHSYAAWVIIRGQMIVLTETNRSLDISNDDGWEKSAARVSGRECRFRASRKLDRCLETELTHLAAHGVTGEWSINRGRGNCERGGIVDKVPVEVPIMPWSTGKKNVYERAIPGELECLSRWFDKGREKFNGAVVWRTKRGTRRRRRWRKKSGKKKTKKRNVTRSSRNKNRGGVYTLAIGGRIRWRMFRFAETHNEGGVATAETK